MSFQPMLPASGLVGYKLLTRTLDTQLAAHTQNGAISRDTAYFEANIGTIQSAQDLVSDRRLMRVALGAYGLEDDLDNRYFIRKVLEEGTRDQDSLANKLADERYSVFSKAFGFDQLLGPNTTSAEFAKTVVERYNRAAFEIAVGEQDQTMRLALNAERELPEMAAKSGTDNSRWFLVMGTPALRNVFETALNLPSGFGQLDLDQQLGEFRKRSEQRLGVSEIADFANDDVRERLIQQYLLQSQLAENTSYSGMSVALALLQAGTG